MTQIRPGNPFLRVAETGVVARTQSKAEVRATAALRAIVNHFPSEDELKEMIGHAMTALKRGIYWDRGSIVNLQV